MSAGTEDAPTQQAISTVLPNFFLVGAMRAGTTTVAAALADHPDVYFSPIKEPCYFSEEVRSTAFAQWHRARILDPEVYVRGDMAEPAHIAFVQDEATYRALFRGWSGQPCIGEGSTEYLISSVAAERIAEVAPDAKIVMILRDPVARAYSEYLMYLSHGRIPEGFEAALLREAEGRASPIVPVLERYVSAGRYAAQIERYFARFPRENVLILLFDELLSDPVGAVRRICAHIGARPELAPPIVGRQNASSLSIRPPVFGEVIAKSGVKPRLARLIPKSLKETLKALPRAKPPQLPEDVGNHLRALFREDILRQQDLIGRDLGAWLG